MLNTTEIPPSLNFPAVRFLAPSLHKTFSVLFRFGQISPLVSFVNILLNGSFGHKCPQFACPAEKLDIQSTFLRATLEIPPLGFCFTLGLYFASTVVFAQFVLATACLRPANVFHRQLRSGFNNLTSTPAHAQNPQKKAVLKDGY